MTRGRRRRRARGLAAAAALALFGATLGACSSCGGLLESPETRIRRALAEQRGGAIPFGEGSTRGELALATLRWSGPSIAVEDDGATVVAMAEADGRATWSGGEVQVSYLGRERFRMRRCRSGWCPGDDQLARLRGAVELLARRADAFTRRDASGYAALVSGRYGDDGLGRAEVLARIAEDLRQGPPAALEVRAWQIRVERDSAEVGEDYDLTVGGATRRLRARYTLAREGERWLLVGGL